MTNSANKSITSTINEVEYRAVFASVSAGMVEEKCQIFGRIKNTETLLIYFRPSSPRSSDSFRLIIEFPHDWRLKPVPHFYWHEFGKSVSHFFGKHDFNNVPPCPSCGGAMGLYLYVDDLKSRRNDNGYFFEVARLGCANYDLASKEQGFRESLTIPENPCRQFYEIGYLSNELLDEQAVPFAPLPVVTAQLERWCAMLTNISQARTQAQMYTEEIL